MYPGTFLLRLLVLCQISGDAMSVFYSNNSCYSCSDAGNNPDCQKYEALKQAIDNQVNKQVLLRNCNSRERYCMIEAYFKDGKALSYIRDCASDEANSFSYTLEGRLKNMTSSNNITRCTFDKTTLVQMCLTLCQGKQCNGPLNAAGVPHQGLHAVLISIGLVVYQIVWRKYGIK